MKQKNTPFRAIPISSPFDVLDETFQGIIQPTNGYAIIIKEFVASDRTAIALKCANATGNNHVVKTLIGAVSQLRMLPYPFQIIRKRQGFIESLEAISVKFLGDRTEPILGCFHHNNLLAAF